MPVVVHHKSAVILVILSGAVISTSGLFIRLLEEAEDWQTIFWRGLSLATGLSIALLAQHRSRFLFEFKRLGSGGFRGGLFNGGALVGFVLAVSNTTVANAVFTMGATPCFTALIAWLVLGERLTLATAIAIVATFGGISLMVSDGIATGTVFGNMMALLSAICIASFIVTLRKGRTTNMLPAAVVGALFSAFLAALMMDGRLVIPWHDLVVCLILGGIIANAAHILFIISSPYLRGAEMSLLGSLEFVLGPFWVWIILNEEPSFTSLIGGTIVIGAVGVHALLSLMKIRQKNDIDNFTAAKP